jgi:hypothetical protein
MSKLQAIFKVQCLNCPSAGASNLASEQILPIANPVVRSPHITEKLLPSGKQAIRKPHVPSPNPSTSYLSNILDHETLDLELDSADLSSEITSVVGGDRASNDRARNTGSTAESHLAGDVDVGNVLVLTQQGQVQNDREGGGVGGENDELGGTTVKGLGGLVGALLDLAVVSGLLHEVEEALGEGLIGDGPGWGVVSRSASH